MKTEQLICEYSGMSLFIIVNDNQSELKLFGIINFPYKNIV